MQNLYEVLKSSLHFNKFLINDLVCIEYTCPQLNEHIEIFTQHDYIIHVLSGRKKWKTIHGEWNMEAGDTVFVKKGAAVITQYFEEDFCMLGFFIPDELIKEAFTGNKMPRMLYKGNQIHQFTVAKLTHNTFLDGFFQSMLTYFRGEKQPPNSIVKLKLKELLLNILYNDNDGRLTSYLGCIQANDGPSLTHIMETNYCYNLTLEEYSKMCGRSLSSFKRDFHNHYDTPPGKWLLAKRLDHAANLLIDSDFNISQIAFDSGFESLSHFSRVFKENFRCTPSSYRKLTLPVEYPR